MVSESHRRTVIATDASIDLKAGFAERCQTLMVQRQFRVGRQVLSGAEGPTQFVTDRALPELLPARLEDFVSAYRQVSNTCIVSIHAPATLDNAVHQATLARNLLSPGLDIYAFEAQSIDGGVQFLVETAGSFVEANPQATKEQVLTLLERVQREMLTLLLAKSVGRLHCEPKPSFGQMISCLLGKYLVFRLDHTTGIFRQLQATMGSEAGFQENQEIVVQWRQRNAQATNRLLAEMATRFGSENFELREIHQKNPAFPDDFIGLIAFPNSARVAEIIRFVKRWGET